MTKSDSVKVMKDSLFADQSTINKHLCFRIRLNVDLSFFVEHGTVSGHNTEYVQFDMIFICILSSNFSLSFLKIIKQHTQQSGILRDVHYIGKLPFIDVGCLLRETCLFEKFLSVLFNLLFHFSLFFKLLH